MIAFMSKELKIDAKELSKYGREKLDKLIEYIKNRVKCEVANDGENIILKGEDMDKKYVKTLTKRFLHIEKVIDDLRILVKDGNIVLRERRRIRIKRHR